MVHGGEGAAIVLRRADFSQMKASGEIGDRMRSVSVRTRSPIVPPVRDVIGLRSAIGLRAARTWPACRPRGSLNHLRATAIEGDDTQAQTLMTAGVGDSNRSGFRWAGK